MDFTFLKEDQIWGDGALEVMKSYGTKVAPTDLAVILGSFRTSDGYMTSCADRTFEDDLTCFSWSASPDGAWGVRCVRFPGDKGYARAPVRDVSARPALPPSEASRISPSEVGAIAGIRVAEYGEYPQTAADKRTSERLEELHSSKSLLPTGKNYTFDSVGLTDDRTDFKATSFSEYEMGGKRYIRVPGRPAICGIKLPTGEQVKEGKPYWVQVQPIEWLMDRSGTMVAKKCLFAGIQFNTEVRYDGDFSKTFMKHYLDTYFAKEMEPTERIAARTVSKEGTKKLEEQLVLQLKNILSRKDVVVKRQDYSNNNSLGWNRTYDVYVKGDASPVFQISGKLENTEEVFSVYIAGSVFHGKIYKDIYFDIVGKGEKKPTARLYEAMDFLSSCMTK